MFNLMNNNFNIKAAFLHILVEVIFYVTLRYLVVDACVWSSAWSNSITQHPLFSLTSAGSR